MNKMTKGLKDFLIQTKEGFFTLDFDRLRQISKTKFKEIHIEENQKYLENHKELTGNYPECEYCLGQIEKPEELIREHGGSSHFHCFEVIYKSDLRKNFNEQEKEYFDRILNVFS